MWQAIIVFLCTFRFVINNTRFTVLFLRRFHLFSGTQKCPQSANNVTPPPDLISSLIGRLYPALRLSLHSYSRRLSQTAVDTIVATHGQDGTYFARQRYVTDADITGPNYVPRTVTRQVNQPTHHRPQRLAVPAGVVPFLILLWLFFTQDKLCWLGTSSALRQFSRPCPCR